jgi:hypothetical protein
VTGGVGKRGKEEVFDDKLGIERANITLHIN